MPRRSPSKPHKANEQKYDKPVPKDAGSKKPGAKPSKPIQPNPIQPTNATSSTEITSNSQPTRLPSAALHGTTNGINPKLLHFLLINIQGMNPSKSNQKWKVQALDEEVNSNEDIIPFLVVTESHLDDTILDAEVQIKNYDTIRSDHINRMQGGTILYLHQTITVDEIQKFSDGYVEAVMIHLKKSKLIIASIYRAPNTPKSSFSDCLKTVNTFIEKT